MTMVKFCKGITEFRTKHREECHLFLYAAGLRLTGDGFAGEGKVGEVTRDDKEWIARFWYPFEIEMWEKLAQGDFTNFHPWS
jgi:hypothetical protein